MRPALSGAEGTPFRVVRVIRSSRRARTPRSHPVGSARLRPRRALRGRMPRASYVLRRCASVVNVYPKESTMLTTAGITLIVAVFVACVVEAVEAFTIVLAMGVTRSWRAAIIGTLVAVVALAAITGLVGIALTHYIKKSLLQFVIGALLLVFGLQWLRKAVLRASGLKAIHDEEAAFRKGAGGGARGRHAAAPGIGLVRLRRVVQRRPARGSGGGVYRDHLRTQRGRPRTPRGRRGWCKRGSPTRWRSPPPARPRPFCWWSPSVRPSAVHSPRSPRTP